MELPQRELAVLEAASADEPTPIAALASATGQKPETVTGAAFDLEERGLVAVTEDTVADVELTDEGERYRADGLPEVRLYAAALDAGADEAPVSMGAVLGAADLEGPEVDIALSNYARKGYGEIASGDLSADPTADPESDAEAAALDRIADGDPIDDDVRETLERRDLVVVNERTVRSVALTDDGVDALMAGVEATEAVGQLTPEMLASGEWADVEFADYNVEADAETPSSGKTHVLRATAERVKDVLVGMGFEEMEGPHADSEFWINDALFMPQDHPARTHWDQFALSEPSEVDDLPADLLERVESAHREGVGRDGDGYHSPWTEEMARGVDLRGHTTSLSMRYLSGEAVGDLEPPQRYFSVEKVYRNDTLDATHLLEFFQIEGWVMAEDLSVRDLMGTFTEFYSQFGIEDVRFKPHYNPYTEPSFELFGTHPRTGEVIEIGNSGLFRPEVLEPLGVDCDVMAWGLALERLLMLTHGFEDIRDVHGTLADIDFLRDTEVVY
ncbi:phenylalanine--tRNA ligase subunit alpha [Halarchaeum nitratireducens]|uniref:Phenylalanine--tRNA ligase alpha subunit n=1 Tax=Halarchaeum nitratireducens TaxID=489913 RepID=A0A830GF01_9EURY|nr:phenylalanine--tRNA ligase subunit alpha [Halarchaeum nitratireducens]GGN26536.1 phenylalanine--tRNA ligase subunit alpha [Halarchaeum nitratireducens]